MKYEYTFTVDEPITVCAQWEKKDCPFCHRSDSDEYDDVWCGHPNRLDQEVMGSGLLYQEVVEKFDGKEFYEEHTGIYKQPEWCPLTLK